MAAPTIQPSAAPSRGRAMLTVFSVMILIGAEVFGVAFAAAWAIAGLFELGATISYGLMAVFGGFGCYLMTHVWRRAVVAEHGR